ncbi:M20/M25/M40 family metallo-hydrolase [Sphingomicrobium clamense]|uniref:M20/M25/M40 family metallo-hydrolase n=1 Tax=Sphingomicrobium clamense TaxID=2851013 RepID=A0ABS6V3X2_9SPHN|nr:M20/M25/M40 family metallo-hydrolase [Sphingomicrobium sp. B8]MBW0144254.1 M20/M25/M40 family metallo-hydrolase [Sphingomicrobium sp. B8]
MIRPLLTLAIAFALPASAVAQLSPTERSMVEAVDAQQSDALSLLANLVNRNSGTMNHDGVREVGALVGKKFDALGFDTEWVEVPGTDRAGHLIARHRGDGTGKRILLIGHVDTVFEPDSDFQTYTQEGQNAYGPGVGDNKGGVVVMLTALRAMRDAGTLDGADIIAVITGDEEDSGSPLELSRAHLIDAAEESDIALDYEGLVTLDGRDMGSIARRSFGSYTIRVEARSGHSSGVFSDGLGYGAIYEAARIVDDFREKLRYGEERLTYNIGLIAGGEETTIDDDLIRTTARGKTNIVAPAAILRGELRAMTRQQIARTQAAMRAIVAENLPGTSATIEFDEAYPPMPPTEGNAALLSALNVVNRDMGLPEMEALDPSRRGAADISYVAHLIDGINGLGPVVYGSHSPDERVDIPSVWRQAKRAAILMSRLAATPR